VLSTNEKRYGMVAVVFAVALAAAGLCQGSERARPSKKAKSAAAPAKTPAAPALEVTLDTAAAPEMAAWAGRAKALCVQSYPMILAHLGAPDFEPPTRVTVVFKNMDGVAHA
jgi:hypothetical protein